MKRRKKNILKPTSHQIRIFLIIFLFGFGQTVHADSWEQVQPPGDVPDARYDHSMVENDDDGKAYIFGGADASGVGLNDIWAFNKDTSDWEKVEPNGYPPSPRQGHGAAYCDGKIYVFGGHKDGDDLTTLWVYAFSTTAWHSDTSPPPPGRSYHSMVTIGNKVWLFGGKKCDGSQNFGDLWCYDGQTQPYEWTQKASIPEGGERYSHSAFTANGKMYVYGGRGADYFTNMWVYDPSTDTWTQVNLQGEQPPPRAYSVYTQNGNSVFYFGGDGTITSMSKIGGTGLRASTSDTVLSDTWEYNIGCNTWTRLADLPVGLTQAAAAVVDTQSNHVLLFGGMKSDSTVSGKTYMYLREGTGVEQVERTPMEFCLSQNYPNPFNPGTNIRFALQKDSHVNLLIYNILGQEIKTLVDKKMDAGYHVVSWDSRDKNGNEAASGVYFYRIEAKEFSQTKNMIILR